MAQVCEGADVVTVAAQVAAMVQVQSLAWELHPVSVAKKKKKKYFQGRGRSLINNVR